ncbi:MAG: putative molybdenum carrier protein [Cyanobacteria bacterium J06636_16]
MQAELEAFQVSFLPISDDSTQLEEARGYSVFEIAPNSLPIVLHDRLKEEYHSPLRSQADYRKTLKAIPTQTLKAFEATRYPPSVPDISHPSTDWHQLEAAPEVIFRLEPNEVFVFGSNDLGIHGAGAALQAFGSANHQARKWDNTTAEGDWARWGVGRGHQVGYRGESYAIATKPNPFTNPQSLPQTERENHLQDIKSQFQDLVQFAEANPQKVFLVTPVGTGMAGFSHSTMVSLLQDLKVPKNIRLPQKWLDLLQQNQASAKLSAPSQTSPTETPQKIVNNKQHFSPEPMELLATVNTGGQSGADIAASKAARAMGIPTGGIAPFGYVTDNPNTPKLLKELGLVEGPDRGSYAANMAARTQLNVANNDATVVFGNINPTKGEPGRGSYITIEYAQNHQKPYIHFDNEALQSPETVASQLTDFVKQIATQKGSPIALNIAGNRAKQNPTIEDKVYKVVQRTAELIGYQKSEQSIDTQHISVNTMTQAIDTTTHEQADHYKNTLENVIKELDKLSANSAANEGRHLIVGAPSILANNLTENLQQWREKSGLKANGEPVKHYELVQAIGDRLSELAQAGIRVDFQDSQVKLNEPLSEYKELKHLLDVFSTINSQDQRITFRSPYDIPDMIDRWVKEGILEREKTDKKASKKALLEEFIAAKETIEKFIGFEQAFTNLETPAWQATTSLQAENYKDTLRNVLEELKNINNSEQARGRYIIKNSPGILANQKFLERLSNWEENDGMKLSGTGNEPVINFQLLKEIGDHLKQLEKKNIHVGFQESTTSATLSRYKELKAAVEFLENTNHQETSTFRSTHNLAKIIPDWEQSGLLNPDNATLTDNTKTLALRFLELQKSMENVKFEHNYISLPKPTKQLAASSPVQEELEKFKNREFKNRLDIRQQPAWNTNLSSSVQELGDSNQELVKWLESLNKGTQPAEQAVEPQVKQVSSKKLKEKTGLEMT